MSNLRLIPHNVNGTHAALHRGLHELWQREEADIPCLQEVRCRLRDLSAGAFIGYHVIWSIGESASRNGVVVLTNGAPERTATLDGTAVVVMPDGTPTESEVERVGNRDLVVFAGEGHYTKVDPVGLPIRVVSLYLPEDAVLGHHARKPEEADTPKYGRKMKFLPDLARHLTQTRRSAIQTGCEYMIVGDFSITNTRYDPRSWCSNQCIGGSLPEERNWFTAQPGPRRLVDVVRSIYPSQDDPYS